MKIQVLLKKKILQKNIQKKKTMKNTTYLKSYSSIQRWRRWPDGAPKEASTRAEEKRCRYMHICVSYSILYVIDRQIDRWKDRCSICYTSYVCVYMCAEERLGGPKLRRGSECPAYCAPELAKAKQIVTNATEMPSGDPPERRQPFGKYHDQTKSMLQSATEIHCKMPSESIAKCHYIHIYVYT